MLQFYMLSIVADILAGLTLSGAFVKERVPAMAALIDALGKPRSRVILGYFAGVVGIVKLIVRSTPRDVPVVGDLLPALAGIAMGVALLIEYYRDRPEGTPGNETADRVGQVVTAYRTPLGITGIVLAVLHFLIPGTLFF